MSPLAELRRSAELGMTEDAEPAHAAARERLLQHLRDHGPATVADVEWITRLASAGHVPAAALLERSFDESRVHALVQDDAARLFALIPRAPSLARVLAWRELRKEKPELPRLREWLEAGGADCRGLAVALRELVAIAGTASDEDLALVRKKRFGHPLGDMVPFELASHELLLDFAKRRAASSGEREQREARALLERAASLGSAAAGDEVFAAAFAAAPDKDAFVDAWLGAAKPTPAAACLRIGAHRERASRLAEAISWYERALKRNAWEKTDVLDMDFCYCVAHAFDSRSSARMVDDPWMAMNWHARGADVGDERCLDAWLTACAEGRMGLERDPAAALERAQRFRASGVDMAPRRWRLAGALKAIHGAAAADARWREVAALLEKD